jgi:hypothetical protein
MARKSSYNNGGNSDENNKWKDALPPGLDAYVRHIDKDWNDLTLDVANTTTKRVNGFLLNNIIYYRKQSYTDYKLWEYFREDFEDWTLDTWKLGHTEVVREFRDFLRRNGVYVVKNEALIASNIHAVITNPEEPVWTQEEIQKQMNEPQTNLFSNEGNFNSKRNPHRKPITTHIPPTPTSNLPKTLTVEPVPFKVQDLPEDLTLTSNLPKTLTVEPALPISPAVAIPTSAPTSIPTSAPLTTPMVSAPAPVELTPLSTPKMATALSICNQPGCWSTKHTPEERKQAYDKFSQHTTRIHQTPPTAAYYQNFLT